MTLDLTCPCSLASLRSEAKSAYFSGVANPENGLKKLTPLIAHARSLGFTKVASVGFCWSVGHVATPPTCPHRGADPVHLI